MTPTTKVLTGLAAAAALSIGAVPALAAGHAGPIDPGVYNVDNVHPWRVFHGPSINPDGEGFDAVDVASTLEDLDLGGILEVRQRCSVVVADPSRASVTLGMIGGVMPGVPYSEITVTFCNSVFAWVAENRPDAPGTDEELWVLEAAME